MEIIKKWKQPKFYSLKEECKELVTRQTTIEIPDNLIEKAIAIIDELIERSRQFKKVNGKEKDIRNDDRFSDVVFPLFPNSFYQVGRHSKSGENDVKEIFNNTRWADFWQKFPYRDIFTERIFLLNKLSEAEVIEADDIPDIDFPDYKDDLVLLVNVSFDKITKLRKRFELYNKKIKKNPVESNADNNKVNSITIITPTYTNFDYIWVVLNHDYEAKHKLSMVNKQTKERNGNGNNLVTLYNEKSVDMDASFLGYMNDKIFKIKSFQKFKKTKLLKIIKNKLLLNDGITLKKESKEMLDGEILKYFP